MRIIELPRRYLHFAVWLLLFFGIVQADVQAADLCEASVSLVNFGRLDLTEGGRVSGEVIVSCDEPSRFSVALSSGLGSFRLRKMLGADGSVLKYNFYVDSARLRILGDGVSSGT